MPPFRPHFQPANFLKPRSVFSFIFMKMVNQSAKALLALTGMVFTKNGELVATGAGGAAYGNPATAIAWLVNTLHPLGEGLRAGQIVMTGALHAAVPVATGDVFRAEFDRLGPVTARMS
jgi:2-keto-4-pentenoate hydratase